MPEIWWKALAWWMGYKGGDHVNDVFFEVDLYASSQPLAIFCRMVNGSPRFEILSSVVVEDIHDDSRLFFEFPRNVSKPMRLQYYAFYV